MNKLNKVLLLFLTIVLASWYLLWQAISSDKFAEIVSRKITLVLQDKGVKRVDFNSFEFELFPPGLLLKNVRLAKTEHLSTGISGSFFVRELGVYFNILDFLENKVSIRRISFEDGVLNVDNVFEKDVSGSSLVKSLKPKIQKLLASSSQVDKPIGKPPVGFRLEQIKNVIKEMTPVPVRSIDFKQIRLSVDGNSFDFKKLLLVEERYRYRAEMVLYNPSSVIIPAGYRFFDLDSVSVTADLLDDAFDFEKVEVFSGAKRLSFNGKISNTQKNFNDWRINLNMNTEGELKELVGVFLKDAVVDFKKGEVGVSAKIDGTPSALKASAQVRVSDFDTAYVRGDLLELDVRYVDNKIQIDNLSLNDSFGENLPCKMVLADPFILYDFSSKEIIPNGLNASLTNYNTNKVLKAIDNLLDPLKGYITGLVNVSFENNKIIFVPGSGTVVKKFRLNFGQDDFNILESEQFIFNFGKFTLDIETFDVAISAGVTLAGSEIVVEGLVANRGDIINFKVDDAKIDIADLGNIAGVPILGKGVADLTVAKFDTGFGLLIDGKFSNFKILGFNLGEIDSKVLINFNELKVIIQEFRGKYGNSEFKGVGTINVEKYPNLDININFSKANLHDLLEMYAPIIPNFKFFPKALGGSLKHKFNLTGGFGVDLIEVVGSFAGDSVSIYDEVFTKTSGEFSYNKDVLTINSLYVQKGSGTIQGSFAVNVKNGDLEYEGFVDSLELKEIALYHRLPLGIQGSLHGSFVGSGNPNKLKSRTNFILKDSSIYETPVEDSRIFVESENNKFNFSVNYMGRVFAADGNIDFNQAETDKDKKSNLIVDFNISKLSTVVASLFGHYYKQDSIDGKVIMDARASFNVHNIRGLDLSSEITDIHFQREDLVVDLVDENNRIEIKNGKIELWDVLFKGNDLSFKSVADGDFNKLFNIRSFFRFDASLIEVMIPKVANSGGLIENKFLVTGDGEDTDYFFTSRSEDFFLEYVDAPGVLKNTKFLLSFAKNKLNIEAFDSDFGDGKLKIFGNLDLSSENNKVNVGFEANQVNLNFANKINLIVSGRGKLSGVKFPYDLEGDFAVLDASVGAEIDDFKESEDNVASKYLPSSGDKAKRDYVNLKLSFETMNPIKIQNSVSDLNIWGKCKVVGTNNNSRYGGRLSMVPAQSKFFFRGNEFLIRKGEITFFENEAEINPELDIMAEANVSDYEIRMRVHGRSKSMSIDLSSEPSLSNDSILSLLALGFPSEMTKELQESDRDSLTSIGVGTMILDQLRISRSLKSTLGVKLQVTSEFSEDEKHLLDSRIKSESGNQAGAVRSATKIELRKQLSSSVNMSVSSTVGGSVGEKQKMNVNYNINKVMSAEGIYELRSNEDGEEEVDNTSAGVDLKFKWSTNW